MSSHISVDIFRPSSPRRRRVGRRAAARLWFVIASNWRYVAGICAILLTAACRTDVAPEAGAFALATTIEPSAAHVGDNFLIVVTATNVSSQAQIVSPDACSPAFQVFDVNGRLVGGGSPGFCFEPTTSISVAPGEQYVAELSWRGDVRRESDLSWTPLAPGAYTVKSDLCCGFGELVRNTPGSVRISP